MNGKLVPLRYQLKNGDTVEILTSPHAHPSKDWLTFVKTSRAQARIRQFIRQAEHRRSIEIGREVAEREFRRFGVSLNKLHKGGELDKAANALGYRIADDLLAAIGYGKVTPHEVLRQLVPPERLAEPPPRRTARPRGSPRSSGRWRGARTGGVRISGIDDVLVRYGRCCNPVPGDGIVGFITRGRGVTVHTGACEKVLGHRPGAARRRLLGHEGRLEAAGLAPRHHRRPARHPREDLADLQRGRHEHLPGDLPDERPASAP